MTHTHNLRMKTAYMDYSISKKMSRRKGKGVKTMKVLRTQKKAFPDVDPSQGENMLGFS